MKEKTPKQKSKELLKQLLELIKQGMKGKKSFVQMPLKSFKDVLNPDAPIFDLGRFASSDPEAAVAIEAIVKLQELGYRAALNKDINKLDKTVHFCIAVSCE